MKKLTKDEREAVNVAVDRLIRDHQTTAHFIRKVGLAIPPTHPEIKLLRSAKKKIALFSY